MASHTILWNTSCQLDEKENKKTKKIIKKWFIEITFRYENIFYTKSLVYNLVLSYKCVVSSVGESILKRTSYYLFCFKNNKSVQYEVISD